MNLFYNDFWGVVLKVTNSVYRYINNITIKKNISWYYDNIYLNIFKHSMAIDQTIENKWPWFHKGHSKAISCKAKKLRKLMAFFDYSECMECWCGKLYLIGTMMKNGGDM